MNFQEIKSQYKQSLKSMDTEEHIDLFFYRPLGFAWAWLFAKLGVTPNAVTIASIFLGVGGGILLYFGQPDALWLNYIGIFLIIWANTYDSADGQLARLTKQYSRLGRILDGVSGDFWFVAIYLALVFREIEFGDALLGPHFFDEHAWLIWLIAVVAGACHAKQAAMADYYRQFHLFFLKGKAGSELDSTEALDKENAGLTWSGDFFKKLTMMFYRNYTANQEVLTPNMQRLRRALKERYADDEIPQPFRDAFRKKSLPLMKYANMLCFNTRIIAMFISVIIQVPWLYFAFELIVLNAMMVYMIITHERRCKALLATL
ncbi:MAG: CDP-alcohol phosphatidyltransferase family protein [Bacteroidales bacterium]|nr:CDP-alcohol phosphatidyltransferase family protein [Bacteroidales bacterium]